MLFMSPYFVKSTSCTGPTRDGAQQNHGLRGPVSGKLFFWFAKSLELLRRGKAVASSRELSLAASYLRRTQPPIFGNQTRSDLVQSESSDGTKVGGELSLTFTSPALSFFGRLALEYQRFHDRRIITKIFALTRVLAKMDVRLSNPKNRQ